MERPGSALSATPILAGMAATRRLRHEQAEATRLRILTVAERLFAEQGVSSVSNRQVGEAAGQGNNTAVGYHFGTKNDLVRAIVQRHTAAMDTVRDDLLRRFDGSDRFRDWVTCVVRPYTDHLAALGSPSWYARFAAQVMTEPRLRELAAAEYSESSLLVTISERLHACLPGLPATVRAERDDMAHTLIVQWCAQRERNVTDWNRTATGLIDVIEGIYLAPAMIHVTR